MSINLELKLLHDNFRNGTWSLPSYATQGSAAFDLLAAVDEPVFIAPFDTKFVPTGLAVWIKDPNYVMLMLPRSGKGCKYGVTLGNSVGTIDSDYQGPLMMCVYNRTATPLTILPGEHIAQALLVPVVKSSFTVVDNFSSETARGQGGFGHTRN